MTEFHSQRQFLEFARSVTSCWRYVHSTDACQFLAAVRETCRERDLVIPSKSRFYRAQSGCCWSKGAIEDGAPDLPVPFAGERMKPRTEYAAEGRANPKGIPCLYVASHKETAISEVRPWIGAFVSVANLETARPLRLVDCTKTGPRTLLFAADGPSRSQREEEVWNDINTAFSEPVQRTDDVAGYACTQILAETFREMGYDGVIYRSNFGGGYNVALFDLAAADVVSLSVVEVTRIDVGFEQRP